jgi:hypothetical protein
VKDLKGSSINEGAIGLLSLTDGRVISHATEQPKGRKLNGQVSLLTAALLAYGTLAHGQSYRASDFRLSGVSLTEVLHNGEPSLEMRMPAAAYQDPAPRT